MSDFVNFNKRTVSLPPGCKDLVDVLQRRVRLPGGGLLGKVHRGGFERDHIGNLDRRIVQLLDLRNDMAALVIGSPRQLSAHESNVSAPDSVSSAVPDSTFSLTICRVGKYLLLGVDIEDENRKAALEAMMTREGASIQEPEGSEAPGAVRVILPFDAREATRIVTKLLREEYGVTDEAELGLWIAEIA